jgi:hypothetical protein
VTILQPEDNVDNQTASPEIEDILLNSEYFTKCPQWNHQHLIIVPQFSLF